ncbi:hypothetical protein BH10PSE12_BH10PSE12_16240 [soil metagenome]
MTLRMLIDARHREETRVAIVKGNRIEEFDFESSEHKQLKGNIYLAKVTRVEPSLQAAFVDYGGNRHGFLAFSEIHPDYYQIPREDKIALLAEEAEHAAEEAALRADEDDDEALEGGSEDFDAHDHDDEEHQGEVAEGEDSPKPAARRGRGGDEAADELRRKRMALRRRYKIQDVIKRRQVLLVQVVKEERGNKGAALTTYLSLAGRYCVLMPNTSQVGGISRKISNAADRKRLKSIIADMRLPSTMGCIVRTAGLQRTKVEIKRDFDYLARLWDEIRENTLKAAAPELVHNDSDLIKRAIRDIYNKDIEEVIVEGEDGYRAAKDFMRLLMPSHARRVKPYADAVSLFQRYGVEDQLAAMYHPVVQLKSGGYLVINPTEALVSIDINSGRSTREHGIEQTAVATNLEAAREIARQLRLRDMAGLVVIDFIDMEVNGNVRKVEKAMKESLKDDRARIQIGRISSFGLMEMSRQRLRTGVLEASTRECPHCEGTGLVRTASSAGLSALRMLEEEAARGRGTLITLRASQEAAFYVLNNKRRELDEIEMRYGVTITILPDGEVEGARMSVEAAGPRPTQVVTYAPIVDDEDDNDLPEEEADEDEIEAEEEAEVAEASESSEARGEDRDSGRRRRRRRRGRRVRREGETDEQAAAAQALEDAEGEAEEASSDAAPADLAEPAESVEATLDENGEARRRGRRGRRGGRRRRGGEGDEARGEDVQAEGLGDTEGEAEPAVAVEETIVADTPIEAEAPAPKGRRRPRARKPVADAPVESPVAPFAETPVAEETVFEAPVEIAPVEVAAEEAPAKPKRGRRKAAEVAPAEAVAIEVEPAPVAEKSKRTRAKKAPKTAVADAGVEEAAVAEPVMMDTPVSELPEASERAEPTPIAASSDTIVEAATDGESETNEDGSPRRGWWQRTFGT